MGTSEIEWRTGGVGGRTKWFVLGNKYIYCNDRASGMWEHEVKERGGGVFLGLPRVILGLI